VADAVAELMIEVGYDSLTIEAVAARAGVAKTTVYRRWSAKTQLVSDALRLRAQPIAEAPDTGTLRGDLLAYLETVNDTLSAPFGRAMVGLMSTARYRPELADALREGYVGKLRIEVGELLVRAEARGELRGGLDHPALIDLVISPVLYWPLVWGETVEPDYLDALIDVLIACFVIES
jgi:AcrR family transcriptional regulator